MEQTTGKLLLEWWQILVIVLTPLCGAVIYFINARKQSRLENETRLKEETKQLEARLSNDQHIRETNLKELEVKGSIEIAKICGDAIVAIEEKIKILMEFKDESTLSVQRLKVMLEGTADTLKTIHDRLLQEAFNFKK